MKVSVKADRNSPIFRQWDETKQPLKSIQIESIANGDNDPLCANWRMKKPGNLERNPEALIRQGGKPCTSEQRINGILIGL